LYFQQHKFLTQCYCLLLPQRFVCRWRDNRNMAVSWWKTHCGKYPFAEVKAFYVETMRFHWVLAFGQTQNSKK